MQNLLCIKFGKLDGFITDYDRTKYLVLFSPEKYDVILDMIRYLRGLKIGSNIEKALTMHTMHTNVIILIMKSVFNKNHN